MLVTFDKAVAIHNQNATRARELLFDLMMIDCPPVGSIKHQERLLIEITRLRDQCQCLAEQSRKKRKGK